MSKTPSKLPRGENEAACAFHALLALSHMPAGAMVPNASFVDVIYKRAGVVREETADNALYGIEIVGLIKRHQASERGPITWETMPEMEDLFELPEHVLRLLAHYAFLVFSVRHRIGEDPSDRPSINADLKAVAGQ